MPGPGLSGQAQTVLGPIAGEAMGITLPHEHQLLDEAVARDEALLFKHAGGQTFVDPTNRVLARDPLALARVARATGLNIIMGSGYYVAAAHPPDMDRRTADDIARELVTDLTEGVDGTGVRAGFIGEIGTTWPWTDNEQKVLRASVAAQRETGAALMIHPGRHERLPLAIVDFIRKEGADLERTIMCQIERGHLGQILMSHDIAYKHCLTKWGGIGYHHLLVNVIPRLRAKGADDKTVQTLLIDNPRRAFVYA